jgi:hypothetical protein
MKEVKCDLSRQEFDNLKNIVKDLKKVYEYFFFQINTIAMSTDNLAIEMKYMREEQTKLSNRGK